VTAPSTLYARNGDIHLAYQVIGEGPRDVVLSLDWASHLEVLWEQPFVRELLSSLARFSRVLWFDRRGVGLSDRLEASFAPEDWIDDVAAVMDAAGSGRASLIAHGHAAQMALMAAATHPDRIDSLVLINGFARFSRAEDYPTGIPAAAAGAALEQLTETWGKGTMAATLGPSVAAEPGMTDWYGRLERFSASPGTALARMRAILEVDVRNVLPLVATPTLVIQNTGDVYVRAGHGRYLAEHIPGARLLERERPDHWPVPEPDLMAEIEEFINGPRMEESGRRSESPSSATGAGEPCSTSLSGRSSRSCSRIEACSSTGPGTGSSRPSTVLPARSAVRVTSAMPFTGPGSGFAAVSTAAR
jgi:pimeloyl-ACP methyl ester carboxylesterase